MTVEFIRADSVPHATALMREDPDVTKFVAGGTAVVLMMKHRLIAPERLVAVDHLTELRGIQVDDGHLRIGGTTRLNDIARDDVVRASFPALAHAANVVGNIRIRNVATLGGNLAEADYASDPPAVLISLGARARVQGGDGEREIPIEELITGFYTTSLAPDELITSIGVPVREAQISVYEKFRTRSSEDRPCVGVAATAEFGDATRVARLSVVVGAAGSRPQTLPAVTQQLEGQDLNDEGIATVAAAYGRELEFMDDHRGSAWYRSRMVEVFVARALRRITIEREARS